MGLPPHRDLARPCSTPAKSGFLGTCLLGSRWLSAARSHVGTGELFIHSGCFMGWLSYETHQSPLRRDHIRPMDVSHFHI